MGLKIIIVGGGLGGLAAAGYLRAEHDVTVLERTQLDLNANDYGLSIVSNAFNLLQKAGVRFENLDTVVMTHVWIRDHLNQEMQTINFDTRSKFGGAPSVLVKRAKLQGELLRFATSRDFPGEPAKILESAKVAHVDPEAGRVQLEDGRSFEGDLIVGADGINSVVRSFIPQEKGADNPVRTHDLLLFMTGVPVEVVRCIPSLSYLANPTEQAGLATIYTAEGPQSKKRMLIYNVSPTQIQVLGYTREQEFAARFDEAKTSIIKNIPASRVAREFAPDFDASLVGLFGHAPVDAWRIRDITPIDTWTRGRALLIGDAAHAVTPHAGQGCNITIEDAEALGFLLRGVGSSSSSATAAGVAAALKKFVALRRDRAHYVGRRSREQGNISSDDDRIRGPIGPEAFRKVIYGYQGAEQALQALEAVSLWPEESPAP
ncbi:hypothetical protein BX600DRAFT_437867 [Xylariales sp. PMI_506]|nr:hypothetical protein BX600DRAFT_437867 [Xylariales sp. PMI_506]